MNAKITTTSVTQTANEVLGTKEKVNYFLIIETKLGKRVIQIGKSTKEDIDKLEDYHTEREELDLPKDNIKGKR